MRGPGGYIIITDPDAPQGVLAEADTFTCNHCCRVLHVVPRMDPADMGGLCKQCMQLICPKCVAKGICAPWEQQMAKAEASAAARRSYR